jgi:hypothetical protein
LPLQEAKALLKHHGDVIIDDIREYIRLSLRRDFWRRVWDGVVLTEVVTFAMIVGFVALFVYFAAYASFTGDEEALEHYQQEVYQREVAPLKAPPSQSRQTSGLPLDTHTNRIGMEMIWCPPGTFQMGSASQEPGRSSDELLHRVTLSQGFFLAKTEVTQAQWMQIMKTNPSLFHSNGCLPVEGVSWNGKPIRSPMAGPTRCPPRPNGNMLAEPGSPLPFPDQRS